MWLVLAAISGLIASPTLAAGGGSVQTHTPNEDRILKMIDSEFPELSIEGVVNEFSEAEDGTLRVVCTVTVLVDPYGNRSLPIHTMLKLKRAVGGALFDIFPAVEAIRTVITTSPELKGRKSADSINLDGVKITLGMTRDDITQALAGSKWQANIKMIKYWRLMRSFPSREAIIDFENEKPESPSIFLLLKQKKYS